MKKMLFLFNPRSGKEQIKSHLLRILDIFSKAGYDIHVHVTQCQLDARKTVEHLGKNVDVIVCSGGDGTLNETISGLLQLKNTPSLGYIPAGSTNDFASSLKISKNMEKAAREIVNGFPVPVDAGMFCGDRSFIYGGILPDAPGPEKSVRASGVYDRKRKESGFHQALSHAGRVGRSCFRRGFCIRNGD